MIKKLAAGAFGALLIGVLSPLLYVLLLGVPGNWMTLVWVILAGVVAGIVLGALFPRFFGFIFETIMGV